MKQFSAILLLSFFSYSAQSQCWQSVAGGISHTIAIKPDGTLWAWGFNGNGQLGDGTTTYRLFPVQIGTDNTWKVISAGGNNSLAIKNDGSLWAWGDNLWGQIGDGSFGDIKKSPKQIGSATNWKSISLGSDFCFAIKTDGTLWAWGENIFGQLGMPSSTFSPAQVGSATNWKSVAAGGSHTIAIKTDGTLWAWGFNSLGQLGDGTTTQRNSPVQIGSATDWSFISTGYDHTVALKDDGSLWTWGGNQNGQLGDGTTNNRNVPAQIGNANWKSISTGNTNTNAIKSDGTLWVFGLGYGASGNSPSQLGGATDWQTVASGDYHSLGFKMDGTLWAWGDNSWGNLGDGTAISQDLPELLLPPVPVGNSPQAFCNSATLADIKVTGTNIKWYLSPTGGSTVPSNTVLVSGNHYYAAGTNYQCESPSRLDVVVTINTTPTPPPTGLASQTFCSGSKISDLSASGSNLIWYTSAAGGSVIPATYPLDDATHYYASQTIDACESTSRLDVAVTVNSTPAPTGTNHQTFCAAASVSNLSATGTSVQWYTSNSGGSPLSPTTALVDGMHYYATQTINSLESCNRLNVAVTVNAIPDAPTGSSSQAFCNSGTVANLTATGSNIKWYNSPAGGTTFSPSVVLTDGSHYYATQTTNSCESTERLDVAVIINTTPTAAPTGSSTQTICGGYTLATIAVSGTNIKWYDLPSEGTLIPSTDVLMNATHYYGTQTINGCESESRLDVLVNISSNTTSTPLSLSPVKWTATYGINASEGIKADGSLWTWNVNSDFHGNTPLSTLVQVGTDNDWVQASGGGDFYTAIKNDGSLWGWGNNINYQLGQGSNSITYATSPIRIGSDNSWQSIYSGDERSLAIKTDGTLWAWGLFYFGPTSSAPILIDNDSWKQVSIGLSHQHGIKKDGTLWGWGYNDVSQVGDGTNTNRNNPVQVGKDSNWKHVSAGNSYSLAIKTDGTLWAWGLNNQGNFGDSTTVRQSQPIQIGKATNWKFVSAGNLRSLGIKEDGTLWGWGSFAGGNPAIPKQLDPSTNWVSVSQGYYHISAIKSDGTLWAWSDYNYYDYDFKTIPKQIEAASQSFCGPGGTIANLNISGNNIKWYSSSTDLVPLAGSQSLVNGNHYFATQTSNSCESATRLDLAVSILDNAPAAPVAASTQTFCDGATVYDLKPTGANVFWYDQPNGGSVLSTTTKLASGHYYASLSDNSCGTAARLDVTVTVGAPINAPTGSSSQIICSGSTITSLTATGNQINWYSQPTGGSILSESTIVNNGSHYYATQTISGCESVARLDVGVVLNTTLPPTYISNNNWKVSSLSAGLYHNVAIMQDGTLWAWGDNYYGQLGDGTTKSSTLPVLVSAETNWKAVSTGAWHTLALKYDGTIWAWGYNTSGALGDGTTTNRLAPVQVGTESNWKSISACGAYSIAIKTDGTIWGWGDNHGMTLKYDPAFSNYTVVTPTQIGNDSDWITLSVGSTWKGFAIKTDGTLWYLGNPTITDQGKYYPFSKLGSDADWKSVSAGSLFAVAIKTNGTLWGFGNNEYGQRGDSYDNAPTQIGTDNDWLTVSGGGFHSVALKQNGTLWACGANYEGQLGVPSIPYLTRTITQVGTDSDWQAACAGYRESLAVKKDGMLMFAGKLSKYYGPEFTEPYSQSNVFAPLPSSQQNFCNGATVASLGAVGSSIQWYSSETGGSPLSSSENLVDGNFYYATQTVNSFESCDRLKIRVLTKPANPPTVPNMQSFCSTSTLADLSPKGPNVNWYDAPVGGNLLASTTPLIDGHHYYAALSFGNCESSVREDITVSLGNATTPTGNSSQTLCSNSTVANLGATGTAIKWYAQAAGGTPLSSATALTDGAHYYATQTIGSCESSTRLDVTATINTVSAPTGNSNQTFCPSATVADLVATGTQIKWYEQPVGGSSLTSTIQLLNGTHYYATQTLNSCESQTRLDVLASIAASTPPAPTGNAGQTFCDGATIINLIATGTGGTIKWYSTSIGGAPLTSTTLLSNTKYYASQTKSGCESATRLEVTATVNSIPPAPTGDSFQTFVAGKTVGDLIATGSNIKWYPFPSLFNPFSSFEPLHNDSTYYATQTILDCESQTWLPVKVSLITSIESVDGSIKCFPNPTRGVLNISSDVEIQTIEVLNSLGQRILLKNANSTSTQINLSQSKEGIYLLQVQTIEKQIILKVVRE